MLQHHYVHCCVSDCFGQLLFATLRGPHKKTNLPFFGKKNNVQHWAWDPNGFLAVLGFKDFAGSGVVHLFGGSCAMVAAWACGPRVNRFGRGGSNYMVKLGPRGSNLVRKMGGGKRLTRVVQILSGNGDPNFIVREIPGHSTPFVALGTALIYVSSFALNSTNGMTSDFTHGGIAASRAAVNTLLAACAAILTSLVWSVLVRHENDVSFLSYSLISSLVVRFCFSFSFCTF